jgi:hypothetical protein
MLFGQFYFDHDACPILQVPFLIPVNDSNPLHHPLSLYPISAVLNLFLQHPAENWSRRIFEEKQNCLGPDDAQATCVLVLETVGKR